MKRKYYMAILLLGALILPTSLMGQDPLGAMEIHGFLSQGFLLTDNNQYPAKNSDDGTFQFNEIGINFAKNLTNKLRVGVQLFSRDMGDMDNNRIVIDWAFGDYRLRDFFGIRFGIMKRPEGFYNEIRDIDSLRTWILNPSAVYREESRETQLTTEGLGLYGNIGMKKIGSLDYQFQVGTSNIPLDQATAKQITSMGFVLNGINVRSVVVGSLIWKTPLSGLRVGTTGSRYAADIDTVAGSAMGPLAGTPLPIDYKHYLVTCSAEYIFKNLTLMSELRRMNITNATMLATTKLPQQGWYVGGSYRFNRWFEAGSYYGEYFNDIHNKNGVGMQYPWKAWSNEWSATSRFDINDYLTLKAEVHKFDGVATFASRLNPRPDKDTVLFALKASLNF